MTPEDIKLLLEIEFETRGVPKSSWSLQSITSRGFRVIFLVNGRMADLDWDCKKHGPIHAAGIRRQLQNAFGVKRTKNRGVIQNAEN